MTAPRRAFIVVLGLSFASIGGAILLWVSSPSAGDSSLPDPVALSSPSANLGKLPSPARIAIDPRSFEDGGFKTASRFTGPIPDPNSLADLRQAVRSRGSKGIAELTTQYQDLKVDAPPTPAQTRSRAALERSLGLIFMYEGRFDEAASWIEKAIEDARAPGSPPATRGELMAIRGVIALRRGEIENCVGCLGPSSCIYPIAREAVHKKTEGSREAIRWFTDYLRESPGDLRVIWLLNLASMTLGEYPDKVPPQFLIPAGLFGSKGDIGRFDNVASTVGLTSRGPNLAGGSVFDDFNGDGLPDLFTTSLDADLGASLYVNNGRGFEDRSAHAGLLDQVYALNASRADFDNDGDLDVVLLRGGWESPMRPSLLRNRGDGVFDDVTVAAGLASPIQTEAAAWGDFDNDGWIDLYVCGEFVPPGDSAATVNPDPRNRGRLYRNHRDGTFVDVAEAAGVGNERCAKGAAWGDYDADGKLDLFVSNMGQPCRLYRNLGDGRFEDVADSVGIEGASMSFACWFWDFDNDGRLDLYVNDYQAGLAEVLASAAGVGAGAGGRQRPHLYRNLGDAGFRDVTAEVGLDRAMVPMGSNFGDLDNDGFLDIFLGTGGMSYEYLVPKLMFVNKAGRSFQDVTLASGTGHLQKGHGISFADWDNDGDLDLFCELGGAVPGDRSYNALFQNPGHGRHWLKVRLVGRSTNRSAIGATIRADLIAPDGTTRSIHRTIGNNSSFGGNCLVESIGLLDSPSVAALTVKWPVSGTTQIFRDIAADASIEITEGSDAIRVLDPQPSAGRVTR